jgi:hypothetical protein
MENNKKQKWNLVAPCGLYCGECTAFLNGKCKGCRSNRGLSREYRKYCKIYGCAEKKNVRICIECDKFPCKFFNFFAAEKLEESSWFLDIWANMKQIQEIGLANFLKKKINWLKQRKKCANKRKVKYCGECKQWPCELLKRPILTPVNLKKFKEFMEKI